MLEFYLLPTDLNFNNSIFPRAPNVLIQLCRKNIWHLEFNTHDLTFCEASAECPHWQFETIRFIKSNQLWCVWSFFPLSCNSPAFMSKYSVGTGSSRQKKKYQKNKKMAACCHKVHWHLFSLSWSKAHSPLPLPPHRSRSLGQQPPHAHTHTHRS